VSVAGIGKEANQLEEVEEGLVHDGDEVLPVVRRPQRDAWDELLAILRTFPAKELATQVGISERRLRNVVKGRSTPRAEMREALTRAARKRLSHDDCLV
jgi:hypothetical protein